MPISSADFDRNVIPRWREFSTTQSMGELRPSTFTERTSNGQSGLLRLVRDWQENRSFSFAADLVASAIVLGKQTEARDAAQFILDQASERFPVARAAAARILGVRPLHDERSVPNGDSVTTAHSRIHLIKRRLSDEPYDPFLWVDLAYLYTALGAVSQATRAIKIALAQAPDNRFVLRAASRFFVHADQLDVAHDLLRNATVANHDPWVVASEIAVASAAKRSSRLVRLAQNMLDRQRFSPFHCSELCSALGVLEVDAGNIKRARKYFRASLEDPAENAIAQAAWMRRRVAELQFSDLLPSIESQSPEALTWVQYQEANWKDTVGEARRWQNDQPFSARPAILASYIATIALGEHGQAIAAASQGLIANPNDFGLLNNLCYARAQLNLLADAQEAFGKIHVDSLSSHQRIVWTATKGLLEFRSGRITEGRLLYSKAIAAAQSIRQNKLHALAALCLALEELDADTPVAQATCRSALDLADRVPDADIKSFAERVRARTTSETDERMTGGSANPNRQTAPGDPPIL